MVKRKLTDTLIYRLRDTVKDLKKQLYIRGARYLMALSWCASPAVLDRKDRSALMARAPISISGPCSPRRINIGPLLGLIADDTDAADMMNVASPETP